jgi:hypothetical protein
MPRYVYEGPAPHDDGDGGLARPGDVRDFSEEPAWGPWRLLADDDPLQSPDAATEPPGPPPGPSADPDADGPPAAAGAPLAPTGTEG